VLVAAWRLALKIKRHGTATIALWIGGAVAEARDPNAAAQSASLRPRRLSIQSPIVE
jgi:hypothetical protein